MSVLDYSKQVKKSVDNIIKGNNEAMLGRALLEPFASMNSGSRKLMYSKELEQVFPLIHGEKAIVETGYEIRYGERSSSIETLDDDYVLLAKIPKFSFCPDHHYYAIFGNAHKRELIVKERKSWRKTTEAYGYLVNNSKLDSMKPGEMATSGTDIWKSVAFDQYGNRTDGINLTSVYMSLDHNYEDSILIRDEAAAKYTSPLTHIIRVTIPENYITLNIHGDDTTHKIIPDIGEGLPDCILAALRTEVKDEAFFSQQKSMLKKIAMPDDKYIVRGDNLHVVDIDLYPNNIDILKDSPYYGQFNMYYQEKLRCANDIDTIVSAYIAEGYTPDYWLKGLHHTSKRVLQGCKYSDKKPYTNLVVDIVVIEERPLGEGDKLADRNGGKGVISKIMKTEDMPVLADGTPVDAIINSPTMYGRENPAQCIEVEITHIGRELICYIENNNIPPEEALQMIIKYTRLVVPAQADKLEKYLNSLSLQDALYYLSSVVESRYIQISSKPMSESYDIDRLNALYQAFPFIGQVDLYIPMKNSNGVTIMRKSRRPTVVGKRYTLRLKQYSQEKFSAVSLSSTNIKNENVKSKAATNYRSAHSSTCNRLGYQEAGCLSHMGMDYTVTNLMIHSVSPQARRQCQSFLTSDPYNTDIKLTMDAKSRNAEFAYTYLKAIGLRMGFFKKLKAKVSAMINPVRFRGKPEEKGAHECVNFIDQPGYDFVGEYIKREKAFKENKGKKGIFPVRFRIKDGDEQ